MDKLLWYWKRLRAMTWKEIVFRILWRIKRLIWKKLTIPTSPSPDIEKIDQSRCNWINQLNLAEDKLEQLLAENKCRRDGQHKFLNIEAEESPVKWHTDPQSGKKAPEKFGPEINYRAPEVVGNARNIWEKNRHHFLVGQAIEGNYCQEERARNYVENQLENWVRENPFPYGINYNSCLELGIRLINWMHIERFLRGYPEHEELFGDEGIMWEPIYHHQNMIYNHPAVGSSANNHLVGEMAGLYCASLAWPVFSESAKWQKFSRKQLKETIRKQLFPGGLQREQAIDYHLFCMEFYLIVCLETHRAGHSLGSQYTKQLSKMYQALFFFMRDEGGLFEFGDSDEGGVIKLFADHREQLDYLISLGEEFLGIDPPISPEPSVTAEILKGGLSPEYQSNVGMNDTSSPQVMENSGWYILETDTNSKEKISCLVDAGSLGYLSLAAHGHADALSFQLTFDGEPIFVDPGTYTYHYQPEWRKYFRGTRAHNTLTVNSKDQALSGGLFLWEEHYDVTVHQFSQGEGSTLLEASHNGYDRLPGSPVHKRKLELKNSKLEIFDRITGEGEHDLELRFHLAPAVKSKLTGTKCVLETYKRRIIMDLSEKYSWNIQRGETNGGWYSPVFNYKEPSDTIIGQISDKLPVESRNEIKF